VVGSPWTVPKMGQYEDKIKTFEAESTHSHLANATNSSCGLAPNIAMEVVRRVAQRHVSTSPTDIQLSGELTGSIRTHIELREAPQSCPSRSRFSISRTVLEPWQRNYTVHGGQGRCFHGSTGL
jgi:hypothetical protein